MLRDVRNRVCALKTRCQTVDAGLAAKQPVCTKSSEIGIVPPGWLGCGSPGGNIAAGPMFRQQSRDSKGALRCNYRNLFPRKTSEVNSLAIFRNAGASRSTKPWLFFSIDVTHRLFEATNSFSKTFAEFWKLFGTEHKHRND